MRVQAIRTPDHQKRFVVVDASGNLVVPVARFLKYLHAIGRAHNTLRAYAYSLSLLEQ
jgi:integrase/recombinase XerD